MKRAHFNVFHPKSMFSLSPSALTLQRCGGEGRGWLTAAGVGYGLRCRFAKPWFGESCPRLPASWCSEAQDWRNPEGTLAPPWPLPPVSALEDAAQKGTDCMNRALSVLVLGTRGWKPANFNFTSWSASATAQACTLAVPRFGLKGTLCCLC